MPIKLITFTPIPGEITPAQYVSTLLHARAFSKNPKAVKARAGVRSAAERVGADGIMRLASDDWEVLLDAYQNPGFDAPVMGPDGAPVLAPTGQVLSEYREGYMMTSAGCEKYLPWGDAIVAAVDE